MHHSLLSISQAYLVRECIIKQNKVLEMIRDPFYHILDKVIPFLCLIIERDELKYNSSSHFLHQRVSNMLRR